MQWIMQSQRLSFRHITWEDREHLKPILQNIEVMYAWEHAFSDQEVEQWIAKNRERYLKEGFSYFAAIDHETNQFIGMIGPLTENIEGEEHIGVAYIVNKPYWGQGYGLEGAKAAMEYAFEYLKAEKVIAEIRPNNAASRVVAEKLGMQVEREFIKYYQGKAMPHLVYSKMK